MRWLTRENRAMLLGWSVTFGLAIIADERGVDPFYSVPILFLLGMAITFLALNNE